MTFDVCPGCGNHTCQCPEPDDAGGDDGVLMECPFCDGTGETNTAFDVNGRVSFDCPEYCRHVSALKAVGKL